MCETSRSAPVASRNDGSRAWARGFVRRSGPARRSALSAGPFVPCPACRTSCAVRRKPLTWSSHQRDATSGLDADGRHFGHIGRGRPVQRLLPVPVATGRRRYSGADAASRGPTTRYSESLFSIFDSSVTAAPPAFCPRRPGAAFSPGRASRSSGWFSPSRCVR